MRKLGSRKASTNNQECRLTDKVKARNEKEKESSQIQKDQHHLLQEFMCLESGREHPDMKFCASNACRRFLIHLWKHPYCKLNKYTTVEEEMFTLWEKTYHGKLHIMEVNILWKYPHCGSKQNVEM